MGRVNPHLADSSFFDKPHFMHVILINTLLPLLETVYASHINIAYDATAIFWVVTELLVNAIL